MIPDTTVPADNIPLKSLIDLEQAIYTSMECYMRMEPGEDRAKLRSRVSKSMRIYNARVGNRMFKPNWWMILDKK